MTRRTTDDWEALLDGITPAPWLVHDIDGYTEILGRDPERPTFPIICDVDDRPEDAQLIAAAPEAVAEVVRLREELEALRRACIESAEVSERIAEVSHAPEIHEAVAETERDTADIITRILEGHTDE